MASSSTAKWPVIVLFVGVAGAAAGCGRGDAGDYRGYSELKSRTNGDATASLTVPVETPAETVDSQVTPATADPASAAIEAEKPVPRADEAGEPLSTDVAVAVKPDLVAPAIAEGTIPKPDEAPPRKVELLVKERTFQTVGPEEALRVSYDDIDLLKVLNMEPVTPEAPDLFPDWLKGLDGQRIRIRGFMYPHYIQEGIRGFVLARDNQICCFGKDPKIYDVFDVHLRDRVTTRYIENRPFDVVGVFHIRPEADDGKLYQLYLIDDAILIEK